MRYSKYLTEVLIMTSVVVVGTQWGDEGKGKITDFLSQRRMQSLVLQVAIMQDIPLKLKVKHINYI